MLQINAPFASDRRTLLNRKSTESLRLNTCLYSQGCHIANTAMFQPPAIRKAFQTSEKAQHTTILALISSNAEKN